MTESPSSDAQNYSCNKEKCTKTSTAAQTRINAESMGGDLLPVLLASTHRVIENLLEQDMHLQHPCSDYC